MDAVVIDHLVKRFPTALAVDDVSFSITKGEIFGFLGPNGAGKTTTLHCICQLAVPSSGDIVVEGYHTDKDYILARKQIGLSPQEFNFEHNYTVYESLLYAAGFFGVPSSKAKIRADQLLREFGLYEKRFEQFSRLSGGMKRKASIIKALMHDPKILILDEPTAGIDVEARFELWEFIKRLNKKGMTIILTTHYIEEAEQLCDRIGIISKGKILLLEEKKKLMEDLSRNVIRIHFDKQISLPSVFSSYECEYKGKELSIFVSAKEQHDVLSRVLELFRKKGITLRQFNVEQDTLEHIFRRIVYGK